MGLGTRPAHIYWLVAWAACAGYGVGSLLHGHDSWVIWALTVINAFGVANWLVDRRRFA